MMDKEQSQQEMDKRAMLYNAISIITLLTFFLIPSSSFIYFILYFIIVTIVLLITTWLYFVVIFKSAWQRNSIILFVLNIIICILFLCVKYLSGIGSSG
jgi:hypothetical protein